MQPDPRAATLIFGLLHGFGLASKIIEYDISPDGLLPNLLAFNVGVEIGQLIALAAILVAMTRWRAMPSFARTAYAANVLTISGGGSRDTDAVLAASRIRYRSHRSRLRPGAHADGRDQAATLGRGRGGRR